MKTVNGFCVPCLDGEHKTCKPRCRCPTCGPIHTAVILSRISLAIAVVGVVFAIVALCS